MNLTIVIPAYNEANGIAAVLQKLVDAQTGAHIIVVNDGSGDNTGNSASQITGVEVITHAYNKGYGAALKTGIAHAKTPWVMTYDADGQHTPDLVKALQQEMTDRNDMVVGKRNGYKGPWIRQPGKRLLTAVANYLVQKKIPDLNSGLRAFRRERFMEYAHLFPDGFSLSTTSTVCFFKEGLNVAYVPISIQPRTGKSTVRPRHAFTTLMLILRLIMLFSPLRIFIPTSFFFGAITIGLLGYELVVHRNISDAGVALLGLSLSLFFFGLLADQIGALRRQQGKMR